MKNKNLLKFIGIFMIGFTMLTSCSSVIQAKPIAYPSDTS